MFNEFSRYEEEFARWREDGYPGVKPETYRYIDFLTNPDDDQALREGTLWPHQWDSFLRVVYCHEVLGKDNIGEHGVLLNIVTGRQDRHHRGSGRLAPDRPRRRQVPHPMPQPHRPRPAGGRLREGPRVQGA